MTATDIDDDPAVMFFAAIHRPCPGCRWCLTRRVLTAVWRGLVMASQVAMAVWRGLLLNLGATAVLFAIAHDYGRAIAIEAAAAWFLVCLALLVRNNRAGRR